MARRSLKEEDLKEIYQLSSRHSQKDIANLYGVSQGTISNVLKEKRFNDQIDSYKQMITTGLANGTTAFLENQSSSRNSESRLIEGETNYD